MKKYAFYSQHYLQLEVFICFICKAETPQEAADIFSTEISSEWDLLAQEEVPDNFPQIYGREDIMARVDAILLGTKLDLDLNDVSGSKKRIPAIPVEVWNPRPIDSETTMNAVRDMCKGVRL